jgi:hypothetical protein
MNRIYRLEAPSRDRFGSTEGFPRLAVIVEIPDSVISASGNNSPGLQVKAFEVASDATREQRFNDPNVAFRGWSNTVMVDANLADYGDPSFTSDDGCRAWVMKIP